MKSKGELVFGLLVLGIISLFVFLSLGYSRTARFLPLVVGIPGMIFILVHLISSLPGVASRRGELGSEKDATEKKAGKGVGQKEGEPADVEAETEVVSPAWTMFVWIGVLVVAIVLFGFLVAVPAVVFAFLKFRSKASWRYAILSAAGIAAVMYFGFVQLLEVFLYRGLILILIAGR